MGPLPHSRPRFWGLNDFNNVQSNAALSGWAEQVLMQRENAPLVPAGGVAGIRRYDVEVDREDFDFHHP